MSITRCLTVQLASLAIGLTSRLGPSSRSPPTSWFPQTRCSGAPAPPVLPAGAQIAVLEGNPSEKGPVTLRLRLPANYNIPPHWHSMTERVTVLSGALHVGMGDKLDRKASQTLEPGGFVSLPANMHHFAWTATPTVVQISLEGPFDIFYVNPADNPQKPTDAAVAHEEHGHGSDSDRTATFQRSRRHRSRPAMRRTSPPVRCTTAMIDKRPALIVRCADVADVIAAVDYARTNNC